MTKDASSGTSSAYLLMEVTGEYGEVRDMYFKMILENGHIGAGKSLETVRYFRGDTMVDMFDVACRIPRVKGKDRGTGVKMVQPVSREEYLRGIEQVEDDRYLNTRKNRKHSKKTKIALYH